MLITHGVLLEAGGLLLLGPPPPFTTPAAASSSGWPKLIAAWVMTVLGMMCMGTGQGLIAMPAVDAMRTTIIERQRGHHQQQQQQLRRQRQLAARGQEGDGAKEGEEEEMTAADGHSANADGDGSVSSGSSGGGGGGAMDEELASVMSFTISLGAFAGPMLGGLGIQYLPHTQEWGCPVPHPPGGRFGMGGSSGMEVEGEGEGAECVSGYRWTTLVLSGLTLAVWALLYWHTRAPATTAAATAKGALAGRMEGGEVEAVAEDSSVPPPVVVVPAKGVEEPVAVNDALGAQGDGGYGHFFVHEDEHKEEGDDEAGARHRVSLQALALEAEEAAPAAAVDGRGPLRV